MVKKLLFVCTENIQRSRTAEDLYKDDSRFEVKSAGVSVAATQPLTRKLLEWADYIYVMEESHKQYIHDEYPDIYKKKRIRCLYIDDIYYYMDAKLVAIIKEKMSDFL